MLEFKALELEDRNIFLEYLGEYSFKTYEYSFATLYLWRKLCNVQFAFFEDTLIVRKTEKKSGSYFMQPIGYNKKNLKEIVNKLNCIKASNSNMKYLFRDVEEGFLNDLVNNYCDNVSYYEDVNNFDYIYESKSLISLSGRKLHSKKNHYNTFVNTYEYVVKDIADEITIKDCMDFAFKWNSSKEEFSDQLDYELEGTFDLLKNMDLLRLRGMAVYIDDKIVGFTIGERVNKDMVVIHIEKADSSYRGLYTFISKTFAERYWKDVTYINREEDLGLEGLRKAKTSYRPVKLEKKYVVNLV